MAETMKLTVDTGAVQVDVEDKDGKKIGEFRFNPMDSNILLRYQKVVEFFNGLSFDNDLPDDRRSAARSTEQPRGVREGAVRLSFRLQCV